MPHDVFISYSTIDKPIADAICAGLERARIRCWVAPRDIVPGTNWGEAIIDAINDSRVMVVVFSSSSNRSTQVMREVERAIHKGVPVIPFRIEGITPTKALEYFLSTPHWLDAMTPPLETHIRTLTGVIFSILQRLPPPEVERVNPSPAPPLRPLKSELVEIAPDRWESSGRSSFFRRVWKYLTGE